jgi:hypothetical protein
MITRLVLDWSSHKIGNPAPCRICQRPALVRDASGLPCHKVCAENVLAGRQQ